MATLNITLDQVISYAISEGVSEVTYHCPDYKYSSYYLPSKKSIHLNMWSIDRSLENLSIKQDIDLTMEEGTIYTILHELGHHLQPDYIRQDKLLCEYDAWERGEQVLLQLNGNVPKDFYTQRDSSFSTYTEAGYTSQIVTLKQQLNESTVEKEEESKKKIKQSNFLITALLSISLLIGGTIVYNCLQPKQPTQECKEYDCIF